MRSVVFGKDQIDKPPARLIKKNIERYDSLILGMKTSINNSQTLESSREILREHFAHNLATYKVDTFLEGQVLADLRVELEMVTSVISIKDIDSVDENLPTVKPVQQ